MKIYKVSFYDEYGQHAGYQYFSNRKDAQDSTRHVYGDAKIVEEFEVELSKRGILKALNKHAEHPDNG